MPSLYERRQVKWAAEKAAREALAERPEEVRAPRKRRPVYGPAMEVYFIQGRLSKLVKIGYGRDAQERLRALRLQSPDELDLLCVILVDDAQALEAELHKVMEPHRHHGEWFLPTPELMAFINEQAGEYETEMLKRQLELQRTVMRKPRAAHPPR